MARCSWYMLTTSHMECSQQYVSKGPIGWKGSHNGNFEQLTSSCSHSMLARSIFQIGEGMSQCCKKRLTWPVVAYIDNNSRSTPPKVLCRYRHSTRIFCLNLGKGELSMQNFLSPLQAVTPKPREYPVQILNYFKASIGMTPMQTWMEDAQCSDGPTSYLLL